MSDDDLTIHRAGVSVDTDMLALLARVLDDHVNEIAEARVRLEHTSGTESPLATLDSEAALDESRATLAVLEAHLRALSIAVRAAATGYGATDVTLALLVGALADEAGALLGLLAPALTVPALLATAGFMLLTPEQRARVLSTPTAAGAVRVLVRGADDAILARMIPDPQLRRLLGDSGARRAGVPFAAATVASVAGSWGLLRETPVAVAARVSLPAGTPVAGYSDRLTRVPDPEKLDGAQVVIERYELPDGERRFEVFIAGTVDFNPAAVGEPWDMASNVSNAIGPGSGSYEAVSAAMREAGITADDPVLFTGYSQGGATAARLATSGEFAAAGLVTFGGPTAQVPIPPTLPAVLVEHHDDLVPALGGMRDPSSAIIVGRQAADPTDTSSPLPAHQRPAYAETARLMDQSSDPGLREATRRIEAFTVGARLVERSAYRCERVDELPPGGSGTGATSAS